MNAFEKEWIEERYTEIKKIGYNLEFTQLEDRLKVKFTSNMDLNPSYIEFLDYFIICYGDYGSFVFENIKVEKNPLMINPTPYFLRKVDTNIITKMWHEESAKQEICDFFYDVFSLENEFTKEEIKRLEEKKKNIISQDNKEDIIYLMNDCLEEFDLGYWEENFDETFGEVYSYQALQQIIIMRLIQEEMRKDEKV